MTNGKWKMTNGKCYKCIVVCRISLQNDFSILIATVCIYFAISLSSIGMRFAKKLCDFALNIRSNPLLEN